ncbi:alpha/beta hydrolase [Candidatus Kaiserbacteria bacterium]|nr:alpha/beta hydrolase [Candidatus Kaiserbacteria bacterium]
MKQQILIIHGGDSYISEEEYHKALQNRQLKLEWFRDGSSWKKSLQDVLGKEYDVLTPYFPLRENARYEEWKLVFEKLMKIVDEGVMIIGHSLGGMFIAKYLSENTASKKINAVFIVAAPYAMNPPWSPEFDVPESLATFEQQVPHIFLYQSKDDPLVSVEEVYKFERAVPSAEVRIFEDRGHFLGDSFPEIVDDITSL